MRLPRMLDKPTGAAPDKVPKAVPGERFECSTLFDCCDYYDFYNYYSRNKSLDEKISSVTTKVIHLDDQLESRRAVAHEYPDLGALIANGPLESRCYRRNGVRELYEGSTTEDSVLPRPLLHVRRRVESPN